jgi:cation diffusion facilitator CzcD-associated flavoprotein CzcO
MHRTSVVVIGAGQAGLAVSHLLGVAGIDHVVLERGRTAARWDSHTWKSLRLLTPNWLSRLPGHRYRGTDPAGFMAAAEVGDYLRSYAALSAAPVTEGVEVVSVRRCESTYRVVTTAGTWTAPSVVLATGWCDVPHVPDPASQLDSRIVALTPASYRDPEALPEGGVLVVGGAATGVQLADELAASGRRVVLAVGSHSRVPRTYRGLDICWWLDAMGTFARRLDEHSSPLAARREASLQLSGRPAGRDVDLAALQERGVGLVGRLTDVDGRRVRLAEDLAVTIGEADERLRRLLLRIDAFAERNGLAPEVNDAEPIRKAQVTGWLAELDLLHAGIRSVGHRLSAVLRLAACPCPRRPREHQAGVRDHRLARPARRRDAVADPAELFVPRRGSPRRRLGRLHHPCGPRCPAFERQQCGMSTRWDVVVVGGRAAGASTAMLLARAGLRVLCVERTRFGSDTLSTHALMRAGTLQLTKWGLLESVIAAGTPAVQRTLFHYGAESVSVSIRPAAGVDALYAPRRTLIDRLLVEAATSAGAAFQFGCSVVGLDQHQVAQATDVVIRDRDGSVRTERTGLVIGADGRQSSVAELVGAGNRFAGRSASAFVYGYFRELPVQGYEWFYGPGVSAGAIPTNDELTCVFVGAPPDRLTGLVEDGGPDIALGVLADECALGDRRRRATRVERPRYMRGIPGYLRRSSGPGWALVGDAGYWKDPLSTHGMTDAFRDAELLARAVVAAPDPGPAQRNALAEYESVRDALALPMLDVTERLASYDWEVTEVRQLLRKLASVMTDELELLATVSAVA